MDLTSAPWSISPTFMESARTGLLLPSTKTKWAPVISSPPLNWRNSVVLVTCRWPNAYTGSYSLLAVKTFSPTWRCFMATCPLPSTWTVATSEKQKPPVGSGKSQPMAQLISNTAVALQTSPAWVQKAQLSHKPFKLKSSQLVQATSTTLLRSHSSPAASQASPF